jgi:hypothetical protein
MKALAQLRTALCQAQQPRTTVISIDASIDEA